MRFNNVLNNKKLTIPGDKLEEMINEHSEDIMHILSIKMQDDMIPDEEKTSPDTYGCDCLFLEHFITEDMSEDFSVIAREFLIHEYQNIKDHEMVYYVDTDAAKNWPDRMFERFILNFMMNAVNYGSQYTKNLFLYLHRTYYSREYKQLKKFSSISRSELFSLASDGDGGIIRYDMARILTIAKMMGIDIGPDCYCAYLYLNDRHKAYDEYEEPDWGFMDSVSDMIPEHREENNRIFKDRDEMLEMHWKYDKFLENVLLSEGYPDDYVMLCNDGGMEIDERLARTHAILKKTYKNREFTKDEIILYASIYEVVEALLCSVEAMESRMDEVFFGGKSANYYELNPPLFKAEDVPQEEANINTTIAMEKDKTDDKTDEDSPRYKEETLLKEIDALRLKTHEQDGNIKVLKGKLSKYRKTIEENRCLKDQIDSDHIELIALRNHVYNLTEEEDIREEISVEDMKKSLADLRIIIIGGHNNWRQKMKQEFPGWTYVDATVSGTLEASIVQNADRVYFFTDSMSHSTYFKYMNVVKEHGISFGYIHGVNIENTVRKIYRDLKNEN